MIKKQKLELTWVGKDNFPILEPRILIEDLDKSYGNPINKNMLIHGDNLLAIKALEQDYHSKIKCIYIDPPYNTGGAFEHYDDGVEHSIWLNLMRPRLMSLHSLLSDDGVLFVSISDDECHYLKIVLDEIFGRNNFIGSFIWEKKKKPSFLSNMGGVTEYILAYAKNKSNSPIFVYGETTQGKKYPLNNAGNSVRILKFPAKSVNFCIIDQTILPMDMSEGKIITKLLDTLTIKDGLNDNEFRLEGEWRYSQSKLIEILNNKEQIIISKVPFRPNHVKEGGMPKKMKNLLSIAHYNMATYEDATKESIALFGNNPFDYPKPEKLLKVLIEAVTQEGDIVLDSFLGSGTTAAVAHKLNRTWIGIELGNHAYTHDIPRLQKVINNTDLGGISKDASWGGGGGFKFYELAPSLLTKDKFNNWIISKDYDANMLAHAMAKQEGFNYSPSQTTYWKQGYSTENDFIYTTTNYMSVELLDAIHDSMQNNESLLIACKAFDTACKDCYDNITIKKIPQILLGRCEFGKDDYSLNITEPTETEESNEETEE